MLVTDILEIPDNESDEKVYNCYVRVLESIKAALDEMQETHDAAADDLYEKCRELESQRGQVRTNIINTPDSDEDGGRLFYEALDRLDLGNDLQGCKKAATILKDYLAAEPDSVMANTLMEIINEQLQVQ